MAKWLPGKTILARLRLDLFNCVELSFYIQHVFGNIVYQYVILY